MSAPSPSPAPFFEDDAFCYPWAAKMSCEAMTTLAKQEAARNAQNLSYFVLHPACGRFQELADRGTEHDLQKTIGTLRKKMCYDRADKYQDGPWKSEQPTTLQDPFKVRWDEWTRAKFPRQPGGGSANASGPSAATSDTPACGKFCVYP